MTPNQAERVFLLEDSNRRSALGQRRFFPASLAVALTVSTSSVQFVCMEFGRQAKCIMRISIVRGKDRECSPALPNAGLFGSVLPYGGKQISSVDHCCERLKLCMRFHARCEPPFMEGNCVEGLVR